MTLNLTTLPAPKVLDQTGYNETLTLIKNYFVAKNPAYTSIVEGDPGYTVLQAIAYAATLIYGEINDTAAAVLITHATGSDLDALAAAFAITRDTGETDDSLRERVVNQLETIALGSEAWYHKHTLAANANIRDARVYRKPNDAVSVIKVTNGGSGYTSTPTIAITGGNGTGATASAIVTSGVVTAIIVTNGGSGYTSNPTVAITGGNGTDATASAEVFETSAGEIVVYVQRTPSTDANTNVPENAILQDVKNYIHAEGRNYGGDTQAEIAARKRRFICDTVNVQTITLEPYVVTAEITVLDGLDKLTVLQDVQAKIKTFTTEQERIYRKIPLSRIYATLDTDSVLEVAITWPTADIVPTETEVPVALPEEVLSVALFKTFNWANFRNETRIAWSVGTEASKGYLIFSNVFEQVTEIEITNGGTGYSATPTVTLTGGGGTGATVGTVTVENGVITKIPITNGGTGYTSNPTVTITDSTGINSTATAKISSDVTKLELVRTCRRFQVFSLDNQGNFQNPLHIYRTTGSLKKEPASGNTFHYYFELDDTSPPVTGLVNDTAYGIKILDSLEITAEGL